MTTSSSNPEHIDAPSSNFFYVGTSSIERPYMGSDKLEIIAQEVVSVDGTFPNYGNAHEEKTGYKLFHKTPPKNIGGGFSKSTCYFSKIDNSEIKTDFWQSVTFYGIRQRKISFEETYIEIERTRTTSSRVINGTLFVVPYVQHEEKEKTRNLIARDLVAREPFSEEVICTRHVKFLLEGDGYEKKEKLLVKDVSSEQWKKIVDDTYERHKHLNTVDYSMPDVKDSFKDKVGTNYLSESSNPSAGWYTNKIGDDDLIVTPTSLEPYYGGQLMKLEWVTTKFR